jgi:glycosyltransferase involved in cell wall biosynthesis
MRISAVVLAKDEEKIIKRCLDSLSFCDEIIVIVDDTLNIRIFEVLNKYTNIVVYKRKLNDDFAAQRNFGLEKAKGEWTLFVDADEIVSEELKKEIINTVNIKNSAYYIKRRDWFWGRELRYGETQKARNKGLIRLVKKNSGIWKGRVHEEFIPDSKSLTLNNFIEHYPHQTIKEFLQSINFYSTLRSRELFHQKKSTNVFEIVLFPFGKFILNYFLYLGLLDGAEGFVYAFMMSLHSFLVRAKLYQYWKINYE